MKSILQNFQPISLDEMSGVKLLNRTDTKFVTSLNQLRKLLSMAEHDYRVQEINGQRIAHYYSTYFDTPTNDMYMRHQNGHQNRQKLRIRSYVDSHLNFLEVKTKNNHGRTKKKRTAKTLAVRFFYFRFDPSSKFLKDTLSRGLAPALKFDLGA